MPGSDGHGEPDRAAPEPGPPADPAARLAGLAAFAPGSAAGRAGLDALLAAPRGSLIALDFDGTLAPIVPDPAQARALPAAIAALRGIAAIAGTVAIITGRPALEAVRFAALDGVPGVIVLGHYGRQHWTAGTLTAPPPPRGLAEARAELPALLTAAAEEAWIEEKGDSLAVHTRRAADPQQALNRLSGPLGQLAGRTGLTVEPGRYVLELRPQGSDKGKALRQLASERQPAAVLFCGDDLGDRPAFRAVRELRADGIPGLAVCSGSAEVTGLAGEADLVVDGPDGVVALLVALTAAMGAQDGSAGRAAVEGR